jgi:WD40 repeat protein
VRTLDLNQNNRNRSADGGVINGGDVVSLMIDYERDKLVCGLWADGSMQVFNIACDEEDPSAREQCFLTFQNRLTAHSRHVMGLAMDLDGRLLSGSLDLTIKFWSVV